MSQPAGQTLEDLEGHVWPAPTGEITPLVQRVHRLRRLPVASLAPADLACLIGQKVGLPWLLPLAVAHLERTAGDDFLDGDLLYALLTLPPDTWSDHPDLAQRVLGALDRLPLTPSELRLATTFRDHCR